MQTLCCANTLHDQFLQVTASGVRLVDSMTQQLAAQWEPDGGERITVAAASPSQLVVAVGGRTLVYLELGEGSVTEKGRLQLEADIACLDITPSGAVAGGAYAAWHSADGLLIGGGSGAESAPWKLCGKAKPPL